MAESSVGMLGDKFVEERRRYERTQATIRVELTHPSIGRMVGTTKDISDGGAQVAIDGHVVPPVGTVVDVVFRKNVGPVNNDPVAMKVMHSHKNRIGLMFIR